MNTQELAFCIARVERFERHLWCLLERLAVERRILHHLQKLAVRDAPDWETHYARYRSAVERRQLLYFQAMELRGDAEPYDELSHMKVALDVEQAVSQGDNAPASRLFLRWRRSAGRINRLMQSRTTTPATIRRAVRRYAEGYEQLQALVGPSEPVTDAPAIRAT